MVALEFAGRSAQRMNLARSASVSGSAEWRRLTVEADVPANCERLRVLLDSRANEGAVCHP